MKIGIRLGDHPPTRALVNGRARVRELGVAMVLGISLMVGRAEIILTDIRGKQATVEVTEATTDQVAFVMQGRKGAIKMAELSEESRAAVVAYARSKNRYRSFPAVIVQIKIALQRRSSDANSYQTNARVVSSFSVEGVAKLVALPAAEASFVLITQDTMEKYVKHVEKLRVYAIDRVPVPAAENGARREFSFATTKLTYDSARDPTNFGGDEYRFYIFGLRDPETKQLIDFQSNCPEVESYAASHPEARDALLAVQKDASFSRVFAKR